MLTLIQVWAIAEYDGRLHQGGPIAAGQRYCKTPQAFEDARHGSETCQQSPPDYPRRTTPRDFRPNAGALTSRETLLAYLHHSRTLLKAATVTMMTNVDTAAMGPLLGAINHKLIAKPLQIIRIMRIWPRRVIMNTTKSRFALRLCSPRHSCLLLFLLLQMLSARNQSGVNDKLRIARNC